MRDKKEFYGIIESIDGADYREYAKLIGDFDFARYVLKITHVQEDPESGPTLLVVRVPDVVAGFPPHLYNTAVRRTALEDYLSRRIAAHLEGALEFDEHGIARKRLFISAPGQKILPRTCLVVTDEFVEARIYYNLPDRDGRIPGNELREVFFEELPMVVNASLIFWNLDEREVEQAVDTMEDADEIRQMLSTRGLVAFVAEGSLLARGPDGETPLLENGEPLMMDDWAAQQVEVTHSGKVRGLGIPTGITVILGDEYSGRRELISAIASGIYNHPLGDGREFAVSVPDTVYVCTDRGRAVQRVDLSPFFPGDASFSEYTTEHADDFVSQAAATVEAIEAGARVLVFDESESSAAFLMGDSRLHDLLPDSGVVALSQRARQLADELGVSLVVGGGAAAMAFVPVADTVLRIHDNRVSDITAEAKKVVGDAATGELEPDAVRRLGEIQRWVIPASIDASSGPHDAVIEAPEVHRLHFGRSELSLGGLRQLADAVQTATIGLILYYLRVRYLDQPRPIRELLDLIDRDLSTEGLGCLTRDLRGDLARPRRYEIAGVINRLPSLRVRVGEPE